MENLNILPKFYNIVEKRIFKEGKLKTKYVFFIIFN
jgi:hypothetical protein